MFTTHHTLTTVLVVSLLLPVIALAQEGAAPLDAAAVPAMPYRSAFADYQPQQDLTLQSWREVNDEAGRLGGHVGHVKGSASATDESKPDPADAHSGHHKQ